MDKQEVWFKAYKNFRKKGYSPLESDTMARVVAREYKEPVKGTRTLTANSNFNYNDNILDVLVGYPDSGAEDGLSDSLDLSGFERFQEKQVKADLEHFTHDFAAGRPNKLDEKWHNFVVDADLYKKGNEIRAKVKVPQTDLGKEFVENYKTGKYGASIEYQGLSDGKKVVDWEITGFSFTENPHYNQTKPKNSENQSTE